VPDSSRYGPPGTSSSPRYRGGRWHADPALPGAPLPVWQPPAVVVDVTVPPGEARLVDGDGKVLARITGLNPELGL
jgi:hypothetical protein